MRKLMAAALAALLLALPLGTGAEGGAAATYAPSYGAGWWCDTLALHASWGEAVGGWSCDPNGYYCVKPGYLPGSVLRLAANGRELDCTVGDTVQPYDVDAWLASWVVEVNWDAYAALGLDRNNSVEVGAAPSAPQSPAERCFAETGHCLRLGFLDYWRDNGDVRVFGLPLTDEFIATDTGLATQVFERAVLEYQPADGDWAIRGRRITTPLPEFVPRGVEVK